MWQRHTQAKASQCLSVAVRNTVPLTILPWLIYEIRNTSGLAYPTLTVGLCKCLTIVFAQCINYNMNETKDSRQIYYLGMWNVCNCWRVACLCLNVNERVNETLYKQTQTSWWTQDTTRVTLSVSVIIIRSRVKTAILGCLGNRNYRANHFCFRVSTFLN